ncbi:ROK family protein, partial [Acinetobacter baumannii]
MSYRRWQEGASEELLKEMAERLAHLCAITLSTLDPGLVVLGGPLAEATGEKLLEEVRKRLPRYAL